MAVVTKREAMDSNTSWAQGGIAAVWDRADSVEQHVADTLEAGAGLCDESVVRTLLEEAPGAIQELMDGGARFTREGDELHLGREGGHSAHRIVHAADATGHEVERSLLQQVRDHPGINLLEYHFALELLTNHHLGQHVTRVSTDIECFGAYVLNEKTGVVDTWLANVTMLATGGAGQVYLHTTNPSLATGDGIAMAYRAKARIANMEFVQFHPTSLYHEQDRSFLISEAVRGAGAHLVNLRGERFMEQYDKRGELAPRDIVARAIDDQLKRYGHPHVLLDATHLEGDELREHFPTISDRCMQVGIDITSDPIPVVPAAHYMCGGVLTDTHGQTSIRGLLACGEVACTGLHGANRLASNSLLEALVVGKRAARTSARLVSSSEGRLQKAEGIDDWDDSGTTHPAEWVLISHNREELQRVMSDYVGIVRSEMRLERAERRTRLLFEETESFFRKSTVSVSLCELRNMIAVGYLIIRAASSRRESRGLHFMQDHPGLRSEEMRMTLL